MLKICSLKNHFLLQIQHRLSFELFFYGQFVKIVLILVLVSSLRFFSEPQVEPLRSNLALLINYF